MSPLISKLKLLAGGCLDLQMIFWFFLFCSHSWKNTSLMSWNFWIGDDISGIHFPIDDIIRHSKSTRNMCFSSWGPCLAPQVAFKRRRFYRTGKQRQVPEALGKEGETGLGGATQDLITICYFSMVHSQYKNEFKQYNPPVDILFFGRLKTQILKSHWIFHFPNVYGGLPSFRGTAFGRLCWCSKQVHVYVYKWLKGKFAEKTLHILRLKHVKTMGCLHWSCDILSGDSAQTEVSNPLEGLIERARERSKRTGHSNRLDWFCRFDLHLFGPKSGTILDIDDIGGNPSLICARIFCVWNFPCGSTRNGELPGMSLNDLRPLALSKS